MLDLVRLRNQLRSTRCIPFSGLEYADPKINPTLLARFLWLPTSLSFALSFSSNPLFNSTTMFSKHEEGVMHAGGAGYIGSHATLCLLEDNYCITIVDNLSRGNIGAVKVLEELFLEPGRLQFIYADLGHAKVANNEWNNVANTIWWQDFPHRSAPDYLSLFIRAPIGENDQDSTSDFATELASFMASLVINVHSKAHWILELSKYDLAGATGHLVALVPGIYSYKIPSASEFTYFKPIGKDGAIERVSTEVSELHKSKRQLMGFVEENGLQISEKNATIRTYLDNIVNFIDNVVQKEARLVENEAQLARSQASCSRLLEAKELIERHNVSLNEELTAKVDSIVELHKKHADLEADLLSKLSDVERQCSECFSSLNWRKERVRELETKLTSL